MRNPHLHAADVNGEHGGEEEHLQEEIGDETHHSEQTELLQHEEKHRTKLEALK